MFKIQFKDGTEKEFTSLIGADLRDANLRWANLRDANLMHTDLEGADLIYADLEGANLEGANLEDANFRYADLRYANFRWANLRHANLESANLYGADLIYADLEGANLYGADLCGIGDGRLLKTIHIYPWSIGIWGKYMQIGCKKYTIEEWFNFSDEKIALMDGQALEWWNKYKHILKELIDA